MCICIHLYIHTYVHTSIKFIDDRRYDEDADRILKVIEALKVFIYIYINTYMHTYIHTHTQQVCGKENKARFNNDITDRHTYIHTYTHTQQVCGKDNKARYDNDITDYTASLCKLMSKDEINSIFDRQEYDEVVQRFRKLELLGKKLKDHVTIDTKDLEGRVLERVRLAHRAALAEVQLANVDDPAYMKFDAIRLWFKMLPVCVHVCAHVCNMQLSGLRTCM